jgi:hypothetical protein
MDRKPQTGGDAGYAESDDALRRVYGDAAVFSRVGAFTLVHLDSPEPDEVARREAEFDPDQFFFDDCPLCQSARAEGGHVVFDGPEREDPLRDGSASEAFEAGLAALAEAAGALTGDVLVDARGPLAARYRDDVADLHDRLVETLWSTESAERVEVFERQFARALTTIEEVRLSLPELDARARGVEEALGRLAAVWRAL